MKFKFDFSIRKLLNNKKIMLIISVLLAFIFWLAISTGQTPTIEQTLTQIPVTLETKNTVAEELGLDEVSGISERTVAVRLSGPAYILGQINEDDIVVSASLSDVTQPGQYELVLSATKKTMGGEYNVISITPSTIQASFDYIDTKQFTISPRVIGVSAIEGLVAEDPVVSEAGSDVITIKGPRTEMQKIASVVAYAESNEVLSATKTYNGTILLYDENNNQLDASKYAISSPKVKISVPISKAKTVPLVATFKNEPSAYISVPLGNTLSVNEVTIIGPQATIDSLSFIELSPIDFNSISKNNNSFDVSLVLPNGVKNIDKLESVTVKINTTSFGEKNFTVSNIAAVNNVSGYKVSLKSSVKNVKMCGPSGMIYSMRAEDLYAVVDLSGKKKGEYTVAVTIRCDKYPNIWQVGTYQATVSVD